MDITCSHPLEMIDIVYLIIHYLDDKSIIECCKVNNLFFTVANKIKTPNIIFRRMLTRCWTRTRFCKSIERLFSSLRINNALQKDIWETDLMLLSDILDQMLPNNAHGRQISDTDGTLYAIETLSDNWGMETLGCKPNYENLDIFINGTVSTIKCKFNNSEALLLLEQVIVKHSWYDIRYNVFQNPQWRITDTICKIKILYLLVKYLSLRMHIQNRKKY